MKVLYVCQSAEEAREFRNYLVTWTGLVGLYVEGCGVCVPAPGGVCADDLSEELNLLYGMFRDECSADALVGVM